MSSDVVVAEDSDDDVAPAPAGERQQPSLPDPLSVPLLARPSVQSGLPFPCLQEGNLAGPAGPAPTATRLAT